MENEVFDKYFLFLDFMSNEVAKRWTNDFPQYFVVCNAIGQEYEDCMKSPYSWYMAFRNGKLKTNKYKIDDVYKHKGIDVVLERMRLHNDMLLAPDIRIWTLENYAIR